MGCVHSTRVADSTPLGVDSTLNQGDRFDSSVCVQLLAASVDASTPQQGSKCISWRKGDLIGTGANGRVYLGLEEETGAIIAVKEMAFTNNALTPGRLISFIKRRSCCSQA